MHGLVLLDRSDAVLRPAILWNDQRTAAECDAIRAAVGPERLIAITGNDALTGFTAPKLVWVRDHEPDVWKRVAHVLLPKDYVRLRLTGGHAMDKADGAGTLLFDLAARDWSAEVLAALEIDRAWMPPTFEGPADHRASSARRPPRPPGLRAGTPVVAGGGDQAANAVGVGVVDPGQRWRCRSGPRASCSRRPTGRCTSHAASSTRSATRCPGRWHLMSVMLSAAGSLRWFRDALAPGVEFGDLVAAARRGPRRQRRPAVPAVPDRRAQPAPGSAGPRRVRRPDARPRSAPHDPGGPGGRGLRAARRPRPHDRGRACRRRPRSARRAAGPRARSGARSWPTSSARRSRPSTRPRAPPTARRCWPPSGPAGSRASRRATGALVQRDAGRGSRARRTRVTPSAHARVSRAVPGAGAVVPAHVAAQPAAAVRSADPSAQLDRPSSCLGHLLAASCRG